MTIKSKTGKQTIASISTFWQISVPEKAGKQVTMAEKQHVKGGSANMYMQQEFRSHGFGYVLIFTERWCRVVPHLTQIRAHVSHLNYKYLFSICLTLVSILTYFSPQVFRNFLPMTKCHKYLLSANIWLTCNSVNSGMLKKSV